MVDEERVDDFEDLHTTNAEQSLLHDHRSNTIRRTADVDDMAGGKMTRLGMLRAYWLGIVVCIAGFLFGYDTGIIGGVLTLPSFEHDFHYTTAHGEKRVSSLAVSMQQLGAFVACFLIWPVTRKIGRKYSIAICSFIFILGAMVQTINTHSKPVFYVFRVIAGLGLGGLSVVVPMYSSEMTPKQIRGQVGSFFQLMFTLGIFTSYWIDYGVARNFTGKHPPSKQWQIPVGMQMLWAGLLGMGVFTLKESTRWLTAQGRHEEAWESLRWIRADDGADTQMEMQEIRDGVAFEAHATEGFHFSEMIDVKTGNLRRTLVAFCTFTAQQATGATAFAYYAPQYFKLLVGNKGNSDLLLTAIFGAVKFAACGLFVLFVAERLNRRTILTGGALFMAACQVSCAAVLKTHPAPGNGTITHSGIATIALIYLFVIAYNFSWGPLPWPYVSEIFPARTREPGIAVGVAAQWLFAFVFTLSTPYMISSMHWGTFLLWGLFDLVIAFYSWFVLTETRGKTLEEITNLDSASSGKALIDEEDTKVSDVKITRTT